MESLSEGLLSYQQELDELVEQGQLRRCRLIETDPHNPVLIRIEGQAAINFSSNDYLGLSHDPRLREATIEAVRDYGTGSGGSRLIGGTGPLVCELEEALARFKQTEAALVLNSGYQANVTLMQALLSSEDRVFCDKLNHASLMDGVLLSGARWTRYKHLDLWHLEEKLKKAPPEARKWIVTDSVFSMDGDYPDLKALVTLAERYGALTLVDEAHATGLFGARSGGLCEEQAVSNRVTLQMGTFSKALGGFGAYAAGSKVMIETLINKARGFIYSTALPPAVTGAALAAIELVQTDTTQKQRLWENVRFFESELQTAGLADRLSLPLGSPIVPLVIGDSNQTLAVSRALLEAGYFVQGIRPPTVPPGTARLRIALSAAHTKEQLAGLVQALAHALDSPSS